MYIMGANHSNLQQHSSLQPPNCSGDGVTFAVSSGEAERNGSPLPNYQVDAGSATEGRNLVQPSVVPRNEVEASTEKVPPLPEKLETSIEKCDHYPDDFLVGKLPDRADTDDIISNFSCDSRLEDESSYNLASQWVGEDRRDAKNVVEASDPDADVRRTVFDSEQIPVVFTNDTVVNTVIKSFISRSNLGFKKYSQTLDRQDLTTLDWVNHTQEELMDAILYLERLKRNIIGNL